MSTPAPGRTTLFGRLPLPERRFLARALHQEAVGGGILLVAAVLGVLAANSGVAEAYESLQDFVIGPSVLNLDLSVQTWAADGLLAIFFFIAGLELKRELVVGSLRRPAAAALPIVAAFGGMVVPAGLYLALTAGTPGAAEGWAIPMATDIAFALGVLAVAGRHLPPALRAFLLTLAIVDDMGAITVIALFYTDALLVWPLVAAAALCGVWWLLQRRRVTSWWIYAPLAFAVWTLVHDSGVHATIAGVVLGLLMRVKPDPGEADSPAERVEHRLRPWSAGFAVPVFAFLAAGVPLSAAKVSAVFTEPIGQGIFVGLVGGKLIGVFLGAYLTARLTRATLSRDLSWLDVGAVALVAGVGFTVSLLITELAFEGDEAALEQATTAVLVASVIAALLASAVLYARGRAYQRIEAEDAAAEAAEAAASSPPPSLP